MPVLIFQICYCEGVSIERNHSFSWKKSPNSHCDWGREGEGRVDFKFVFFLKQVGYRIERKKQQFFRKCFLCGSQFLLSRKTLKQKCFQSDFQLKSMVSKFYQNPSIYFFCDPLIHNGWAILQNFFLNPFKSPQNPTIHQRTPIFTQNSFSNQPFSQTTAQKKISNFLAR